MSEAVMKRHPTLAVWLQRAGELVLPAACAVVAAIQAAQGKWSSAIYWLVSVLVLLVNEWRLQHAWSWGWNRGRMETLERLTGLVDLESPEALTRLREAYMADPPTWRQTQDRLAQIDYPATIKASLDELERLRADEAFTCPRCGMTSYNRNDATSGYCGNCRAVTAGRE